MADDKVLPIELEELEQLRARLLVLAEERGLTQRDLEKAAMVSHSTYDGMWRRGTVTIPRLRRIAELLDLPLGYFLPVEHQYSAGDTVEKRPYVEDRLELVERDLRILRSEMKNQKK